VDREAFGRWLGAYFVAWVSNDPGDVAALFTEDATYAVGPFADVWEGRDEIVRWWTSVAQDDVEYAYEVLAAEGETGIAHWNVKARSEGEPHRVEWDGILLITFTPDGRCRDHREWLVRRELPARSGRPQRARQLRRGTPARVAPSDSIGTGGATLGPPGRRATIGPGTPRRSGSASRTSGPTGTVRTASPRPDRALPRVVLESAPARWSGRPRAIARHEGRRSRAFASGRT